MLINELPRYEILDEARCRSSTAAGAASSASSASTSSTPRGDSRGARGRRARRSRASSSSSIRTGSSSRWRRRRASSTCRRATPSDNIHVGGKHMAFGAVYGCPFVRRGLERREATYDGLREPRQARAGVPAARHAGRDDLRAERQAARLAPPRHGLRAADALRQAVHGLGHVGPERARHDRDGRDGVRPGVARADAGDHLADQRQLAAALRRPHALGAARVRAREPGDDRSRRSC